MGRRWSGTCRSIGDFCCHGDDGSGRPESEARFLVSAVTVDHSTDLRFAGMVASAICGRGMRRIMARPTLIMPVLLMPLIFVVSFTGAFG
ncbi:MAG TPA: hypothetical protein DGK99_07275, partial [Acidimicrobiaceae bacterium]|nr:hypothetical protein [Acidimicrobiaceae bacterium]